MNDYWKVSCDPNYNTLKFRGNYYIRNGRLGSLERKAPIEVVRADAVENPDGVTVTFTGIKKNSGTLLLSYKTYPFEYVDIWFMSWPDLIMGIKIDEVDCLTETEQEWVKSLYGEVR